MGPCVPYAMQNEYIHGVAKVGLLCVCLERMQSKYNLGQKCDRCTWLTFKAKFQIKAGRVVTCKCSTLNCLVAVNYRAVVSTAGLAFLTSVCLKGTVPIHACIHVGNHLL